MERSKEQTIPIILVGENQLTYKIITDFMSTKKKQVKVNKHLAEAFQKDILGGESILVTEGAADDDIEVLVRMSESTYIKIQSSISFLYRESGCKQPQDFSVQMSNYMKGSKRVGKNAKQSLALSLGRKCMKNTGLLIRQETRKIHGELCIIICWNMKQRIVYHLERKEKLITYSH